MSGERNGRFRKIIGAEGRFTLYRGFIVLALCLGVLTGCTQGERGRLKEPGGGKVFTIGLIPEQNIFKQLERYTPLAEYLSRKTGMKIELKVLTRYGNIIDNFISAGMDGAFFGSFTYALAHVLIGVEVLARPQGLDGLSTYHGLIFVRNDSGINGMTDMKGKRFAFVDKATTAGFLLPLWFFKTHGINDYKTYFKETYFAGTHEDAVYDVFHKKADIGAAKNTIFEKLVAADPRIREGLKILTKSPDVPENGLALRKNIDPSAKTALRDALLNMHNGPDGKTVLQNFGAQRFIPTTNKDYDPVFRYAEEIGLDLSRYDYVNE